MKEYLKIILGLLIAVISFSILITMVMYLFEQIECRAQYRSAWCKAQIENCDKLCLENNFESFDLIFADDKPKCACKRSF